MSVAVPYNQRHVVVIELDGPKDDKAFEAFRAELERLVAAHGAKIVIQGRGAK
jgi:hypothetical protein